MKKLKIVSVLFVFILVGMFLNLSPMKVLASGELSVLTGADNPLITQTSFKATGYVGGEYFENFPASSIVEKGFIYWNTSNGVQYTASSGVYWTVNPPTPLHSGFYHNFTGMICGNTYEYKAYVKNAEGITVVAPNSRTVGLSACNITAPTVITNESISGDIGSNSAFLRSTITNGGNNGDFRRGFQYGKTTSYGLDVHHDSTEGSMRNGTFNWGVKNLECGGVTYHYRAYADNGVGGNIYGDDRTFVTGQCWTQTSLPATWGPITITDANPHFMVLGINSNPRINNIPINAGDWIGAFYVDDNGNEKCAGADVWMGGGSATLFPIQGDHSPDGPKNGVGYGDMIKYKVFSYTTNKEYDILPEDITWDTENYYSGTNWYPLRLSYATNLKASTPTGFDAYAVASPSSVCAGIGDTVSLTAKVQDPPFSGYAPGDSPYDYEWFTGNTLSGSNSTFVTSAINNVTDGFSKYFLKGEDSDGLISPKHPVIFDVKTQPVVAVSANINTVCVGDQYSRVDLNSSISGDYGNILWTSSDSLGTFSSNITRNPKYYYGSTPGVKNITLTAQPKIANVCSPASASLALNVLPNATVNAGADASLCVSAGTPINISATVEDYISNPNSFIWTGGTGTFGNNQSLTTTYTPSANDIAAGSVTLKACAKSQAPCSQVPVCDQVVYNFTQVPTGNTPTSLTMCENQTKQVGGIFYNYTNLDFTSSGNGTFTPSNPVNPLKRNYTPSDQEKLAGGSTVTVTASSNSCPSSPFSKQTQVTIVKLPTVNAGPDISSTGGTPIVLSATASNYGSVSWTKSGTGSITGAYTLTPTYIPSQADINAGSVTLTVKAIALSACGYNNSITDQVVITLQPGNVPPPPNSAPTVTTTSFTSVTSNGVVLNGSVGNLGGAASVSRGFQYGLTTNYGTTESVSTGGTGSFYKSITGLACNTTYHFRAYASSAGGTGNGLDMTFTTSACPPANTPPSVTTGTATSPSQIGITLNGNIDNVGNPAYTQRGFKYKKPDGTVVSEIASGVGIGGSFTKNISGLTCGTTYTDYYAYAINTAGTINGNPLTFTTSACPPANTLPSVTTNQYTLTSTGATFNGTIDSPGVPSYTSRGFKYSKNGGTETSVQASGTGTAFSKTLTLDCGLTYSYRAFVTNSVGTDEGDSVTFQTSACPTGMTNPTVVTIQAYMSSTNAVLMGSITNTGNGTIIEKGFEFGTTEDYGTPYPISTAGTAMQKSIPLSSLVCGTTYHYRAYAKNAEYTGFGADKQFTTNSCQAFLNGNMLLGNALSGFNSAKMLLATSITPNDRMASEMELNKYNYQKNSQKSFTRTLKMEMTGDDILALQKFLNNHGYILAKTGPGSPGNETNKFGKLMRNAVMKFQKAYGLTADGIVGPKMMAKVAELE